MNLCEIYFLASKHPCSSMCHLQFSCTNNCRFTEGRARNRPAYGCAVSCSAFVFFFVGEQTQTPTANCLHRMVSSSANYRPFLSSFRHIPTSGGFCQVSELTVYTKKWRPNGEMVQLGPKSFGDGRQDICKDKASNLGPAAG